MRKSLALLVFLTGCTNIPLPQTGVETFVDPIGRFHNHRVGVPSCADVTLTKDPDKLLSYFVFDKPYSDVCVIEHIRKGDLT